MNAEAFTSLLGRAVDYLFLDDRRASSMGIAFGATVLLLARVFEPALAQQSIVDLTSAHPVLFLVAGMFFFNLPRFLRGASLPRTTETRLKLVRSELRAKRISHIEAQELYKRILEEELRALVIDRARIPPSTPASAAQ
jgi:hypothetical protein